MISNNASIWLYCVRHELCIEASLYHLMGSLISDSYLLFVLTFLWVCQLWVFIWVDQSRMMKKWVWPSFWPSLTVVCFYSSDGKYLLTGGEDDLVQVWSMDDRKTVAWGEGHNSWVLIEFPLRLFQCLDVCFQKLYLTTWVIFLQTG